MVERAFDPYAVLGVPRDASRLQIARARRRLAKRHHPDRQSGHDQADEMRRINRAWEILSDPARRARHDAETFGAGPPPSGHWAAAPRRARAGGQATSATWRRDPMPPGSGTWTPRPAPARPAGRQSTASGDLRESGWPAAVVAVAIMVLYMVASYLGSSVQPM